MLLHTVKVSSALLNAPHYRTSDTTFQVFSVLFIAFGDLCISLPIASTLIPPKPHYFAIHTRVELGCGGVSLDRFFLAHIRWAVSVCCLLAR